MKILTIALAAFYWRLYPAIRAMDGKGQITPKGYPGTLDLMLAVALVLYFTVFR